MADTGWLDPATVQAHGGGPVAWSDITNAAGEDADVAVSDKIRGGVGETTEGLECVSFNVNLPVGATPNGVEVRIKRAYETGTSSDPARDAVLSLVVGGSPSGFDKADTGTDWPGDTVAWSATYGGAADDWGTGIDRDAVNSSDFGVVLEAQCGGGFGDTSVAWVDAVQIKVYYTEASSGHPTMRRFGGVPGMGQGQKIGRSW